jgi:hypothetical protein
LFHIYYPKCPLRTCRGETEQKFGNLENPRTKSQEDRIYGELTTRTRFLNKVQGRQNIWRAYSKGKIPQQSPRRTEYVEGYRKDTVPEQSPRRTAYKESLHLGQGSRTKSMEERTVLLCLQQGQGP